MLQSCNCGSEAYRDSSKTKHGRYAIRCATLTCYQRTGYFSSMTIAEKDWPRIIQGGKRRTDVRPLPCQFN